MNKAVRYIYLILSLLPRKHKKLAVKLHVNMFLFGVVACLICGLDLTAGQVQAGYSASQLYKAEKMYSMSHLQMNPTSVQLVKNPISSTKLIPFFDLVLLSYSPRSEIKRIAGVGNLIDFPEVMAAETKIVTDENILKYPNSVGVLPPESLDKQPLYVWWVATGMFGSESSFLSNEGGIYLVDMTKEIWAPVAIYKEPNVGFSHVEWFDMDLDKKTDCITVKGSSNMAQLIWLRQPRGESGQWTPQPISNVTDVGGNDFRVMHVRRAGSRKQKIMLIIVAGRRNGRLTAHWVDDPDNDWTQTSKIKAMDIARGTPDQLRDSYISVEIADLNGDGIPEVLTSVAAVANTPGRIVSFQIPQGGFDPTKLWRRRTLYEWPVTATNYGLIFPGPSFKFFVSRSSSRTTKKPHILISGANGGSVYVLSPTSWSPKIWTYSIQTIFSSKQSVGIPSAADVEGDGNVEIFIPSGKDINVYKYKPSSSAIRLVFGARLKALVTATVFISSYYFSFL